MRHAAIEWQLRRTRTKLVTTRTTHKKEKQRNKIYRTGHEKSERKSERERERHKPDECHSHGGARYSFLFAQFCHAFRFQYLPLCLTLASFLLRRQLRRRLTGHSKGCKSSWSTHAHTQHTHSHTHTQAHTEGGRPKRLIRFSCVFGLKAPKCKAKCAHSTDSPGRTPHALTTSLGTQHKHSQHRPTHTHTHSMTCLTHSSARHSLR